MNQIEQLQNEDGRYKIKRLSDYKIQLTYKVPIFAIINERHSIKVIDLVEVKVRYEIKKDELRHHNELPVYHMIKFKERFMQQFSQKWKIKKTKILFQRKSGTISTGDHLISGLYTGFIFDDIPWYRDYQITKILADEVNTDQTF